MIRVCLACGEYGYHAVDSCPECGGELHARIDSLATARRFARLVRARRSDDNDTLAEVCAAYERLAERVAALESANAELREDIANALINRGTLA